MPIFNLRSEDDPLKKPNRVTRLSATIVISSLFVMLMTQVGLAAPQIYGTKAYGMGGAFTGIADDISALMYNPAGLSRRTFQADLGIGSNLLGEALELQSYIDDPAKLKAEPINLNLMTMSGVSFMGYGIGLAAHGTVTGATDGCESGANFCANGDYLGRVIIGAAFNPPFIPLPDSFKFGLTYSHLRGGRMEYRRTDHAGGYVTDVTESEATGSSIGIGLLFTGLPMIDIGVAIDNAVSNLDWTTKNVETVYIGDTPDDPSVTTMPAKAEKLDTIYRAGVSIKPPVVGLTLSADVSTDGTLAYGAAKDLLLGAINVRAGQHIKDGTTTTTLGLGAGIGPVQLDIATGTEDFKDFGFSISGSVKF